jgi:hypothetical protein
MSTTDELLNNAKGDKEDFTKGELSLPPARNVAVLACMDARLNPYGLRIRRPHRRSPRGRSELKRQPSPTATDLASATDRQLRNARTHTLHDPAPALRPRHLVDAVAPSPAHPLA